MNKLLWHSNAPWAPTGYGNQTALFAPGLAEHYDLAISAFYGLEGAPRGWHGIPVLPGLGGGDYGTGSIIEHARQAFGGDLRAGLVATLLDVWVLDAAVVKQLNTACWVPVDHDPAPPAVIDFFMGSDAVPIAMTRFGQQMLGRLDPLYCPHAVDTDIYKPLEQDARGDSFPDGAFVVGMVAANKGRPSRKCFSEALQAFARFAEAHDNAFLYLHTILDPNRGLGENLPALMRHLELPMDRIRIANQYAMCYAPYSGEDMAKIYSGLDVLLNPSAGEGFGIPVLEAQACGVPCIVTDFSAMPEVCGSGWQVDWKRQWTGQNSWQATPDVDSIEAALEDCYGMSARQRQLKSEAARKHALTYALPRVLEEHMLPALRKAEQRFRDRDPVTVAPRLRAAA